MFLDRYFSRLHKGASLACYSPLVLLDLSRTFLERNIEIILSLVQIPLRNHLLPCPNPCVSPMKYAFIPSLEGWKCCGCFQNCTDDQQEAGFAERSYMVLTHISIPTYHWVVSVGRCQHFDSNLNKCPVSSLWCIQVIWSAFQSSYSQSECRYETELTASAVIGYFQLPNATLMWLITYWYFWWQVSGMLMPSYLCACTCFTSNQECWI